VKLHYYPETDSLYVELRNDPAIGTRVITDGLLVDLDSVGRVVGLDFDRASEVIDLSTIEVTRLQNFSSTK
jgi:uncharacterized protein YuzE